MPTGGTVTPSVPVLRPSGFEWVAARGIISLFIIGLLTGIGIWTRDRTAYWRVLGLVSLAAAVCVSFRTAQTAFAQTGSPVPLQLSLPILAAGETIHLQVDNIPLWRVNVSWLGLAAALGGIALIVLSFRKHATWRSMLIRCGGMVLIALGVLLQGDGAPWFYGLLALTILLLLFVRSAIEELRNIGRWMVHVAGQRRAQRAAKQENSGVKPGTPVHL